MKTYAIGDIHGCYHALHALMIALNPGADDTLIFLGDYVDRGPDTPAVLDWLIDHSQTHNIVTLRGNHEVMMMESRENPNMFHGWTQCGGRETLESYGWEGDPGWPELVPSRHWRLLEDTHSWMETDDFIFVHANIDPDLELHEHTDMHLFWEKCRNLKLHKSGRRTVVGHTRQTSGVPRQWKGGVCIDTAAVGGHWLTCLEVESGEFVQANQQGDVREGSLVGW